MLLPGDQRQASLPPCGVLRCGMPWCGRALDLEGLWRALGTGRQPDRPAAEQLEQNGRRWLLFDPDQRWTISNNTPGTACQYSLAGPRLQDAL